MSNNIIPYHAVKQAIGPLPSAREAVKMSPRLMKWLKRLGLFGGGAVVGAPAWNMYGPESWQEWLKAHTPHVTFGDGSGEGQTPIDPLLLGGGGALLGGLGAYSMTDKNDENRAIKALLGAGGGGLLGYLLANYLKQNAGS